MKFRKEKPDESIDRIVKAFSRAPSKAIEASREMISEFNHLAIGNVLVSGSVIDDMGFLYRGVMFKPNQEYLLLGFSSDGYKLVLADSDLRDELVQIFFEKKVWSFLTDRSPDRVERLKLYTVLQEFLESKLDHYSMSPRKEIFRPLRSFSIGGSSAYGDYQFKGFDPGK